MLFFVLIILSLSFSVFTFVILWFFPLLFLSFLMLSFVSSFYHLLLCHSLFLVILSLSLYVFLYVILSFFPFITFSFCLFLCYSLFFPSITLLLCYSLVLIILSLSLSVFPFWFTRRYSKMTSFWRRGSSFLTNLKSWMSAFPNLAWRRETTRRMRKTPTWRDICDVVYVDVTN